MESLDVSKPKTLQFDVSIGGIDHTKLTGQFQVTFNEVVLTFPVEIREAKMLTEIPAIQSILKDSIPVGSKVDCNLLIFGEGYYWNPWSSSYEASTSVYVESVREKPQRHKKSLLDEDKALFDQFNIPDSDSKGSEGYIDQSSKTKPMEANDNNGLAIDGEQAVSSSPLDFPTYRQIADPSLDRSPVCRTLNKTDKKQIMAQEIDAVRNGKPLSETNKNDDIVALKFRTRVRDKLLEAIKESKNESKKVVVNKQKTIKESIEDKQTQMILNDHVSNDIDNGEINESDVINLMISHGMTKSTSQQRMIESATGGSDKIIWPAVYSTINNMLKPNVDSSSSMEEQIKFMSSKFKDNSSGSLMDNLRK